MKALIQRVSHAHVSIEGDIVGSIDGGILVLLGVERTDTEESALRLLEKILRYRIFSDENGKMNKSLQDCGGELLIVSQFTLVADTKKGNRPGFSLGASPELGEQLYEYVVSQAKERVTKVATGRFGADMKVTLTNDGPVTFWLES